MTKHFLTLPIETLPATAAAEITLENLNELREVTHLAKRKTIYAQRKAAAAGWTNAALQELEAVEAKYDSAFDAYNSAYNAAQ